MVNFRPGISIRRALQRGLLDRVPLGLKKAIARRFSQESLLRQKIASADAVFVSAPKAGRTWVRLMVARALQSHFDLEIENLLDLEAVARSSSAVPRVYFTHDEMEGPRDWRSLRADTTPYQETRLLLLCRDPRDTLVSLYYQRSYRDHDYKGTLSEFLREDAGALFTIVAFYQKWARALELHPRARLLTYEGFHRDPAESLQGVLEHLGIRDVRPTTIQGAVEFSRFDNMRRLELSGTFDGRLRPRDTTDERSYKTRSGKVGEHAQSFSGTDMTWLNGTLRREFPTVFGYDFAEPSGAGGAGGPEASSP